MAHDADDASSAEIVVEPDFVRDSDIAVDLTDTMADMPVPPSTSSRLLAITGESPSLEEHAKSLRRSIHDDRARTAETSVATALPRTPSLILPTASDFGTRPSMPGAAPLPPRISQTSEAAEATPSTQPPSLRGTPGAPRSKGPPPLPSRSGPPSRAQTPGPPPVSVRPPSLRPPPPPAPEAIAAHVLIELLATRILALESTSDRVGLGRAHLEMALVQETIGDESRVNQHAEAALRAHPQLGPAHGLLRRRKHGRAAIREMLEHLDSELEAASAETASVELLVERARLLEASGELDVRVAWEQALARAPNHAAALKGLEGDLAARANIESPGADDALANHLGRMADAYASEPKLAAWLHVERAQILERRLGRVDAARGALDRAIHLDESVGPVRKAYVRHLAAQGDMPALVSALDEEAHIEADSARAARLELDAAVVARLRLRDDNRAISLLERAAARIPTVESVDRRVLDDLVQLYEDQGLWQEAATTRRSRLRFFTEPGRLAHELRLLATLGERIGDLDAAVADLSRALALDAADSTLAPALDRLLTVAERHDARIALWVAEAERASSSGQTARALLRAAQVNERLGRSEEALRTVRTAWQAAPADPEVLDVLSRLLAPTPSETAAEEARSLIELYGQAVSETTDPGRKVAYLEKVALLWEDFLGDAHRAAHVYEDILTLEPGRRGAILGLGRNAARIGDDRALARALLEEAKAHPSGPEAQALRVRAAVALARVDTTRAMALTLEVLAHNPSHEGARELETRLHEEAGRWEAAAASLKERLRFVQEGKKAAELWLALANIQHGRLRAPQDALASLRAAAQVDPGHPVPPTETARVLAAMGDDKSLRDALIGLADDAKSPEERVGYLARAAELEELRLGNDDAALAIYRRALESLPDDPMLVERVTRVLVRRSATVRAPGAGGPKVTPATAGERADFLTARLDRAASPDISDALSFELAQLYIELGQDLPHASALLDSVLSHQGDHVPALRSLELIARKSSAWAPLARVLSEQGTHLVDLRARVGALWNLAALEEWRLPGAGPSGTYERILELDPTDAGALEAIVRQQSASARRGDASARRALIGALRALSAIADDDATQIVIQLRLAILLEVASAEGEAPVVAREALDRYHAALLLDPLSVTAATSLARLSNRMGDAYGAVAAATSLAELSAQPRVRARYLNDAAELLLGTEDERLGIDHDRRSRAARLLERALEADPDLVVAAQRLVSVRLDLGQPERIVDAFRAALAAARNRDAIVLLGSEIARVAREELGDIPTAIGAMKRVREVAPDHVPSLLTLAELCIADRAWDEAVDALETIVKHEREPGARMTALFALASIYEKVLPKPADAERVLRDAVATEPRNPRALRAMIHHLAVQPDAEAPERRTELAELMARLADTERDPAQRGAILLELADLRADLGHAEDAERALVEAVAHQPDNPQAFARLGAHFTSKKGRDAVSYARALHATIGLGQKLGRIEPRWLAALGQVEVESLGRLRDGVVHLQRAVQMDPTLYEVRFELASALSKLNGNEEASRTVLAMLTPTAEPLLALADPGGALELLEKTLTAERRADEGIVVSELRAITGELDEGRHAWLRGRKLPPLDASHAPIERATLLGHVVPEIGRDILLDVAGAISGLETKILRADVTELGLSPRDRITAKSGHPTRLLLDRLARALGLSDIDLVITQAVNRTRVLAQDTLWVVMPRSLSELPEHTQLASLARALARIALGIPWIEELPPPHIEAYLVASARQVAAQFGAKEVDVIAQKLVIKYEPMIAKVLGRKQKRALEELAGRLTNAPWVGMDVFLASVAQAELRTAYLLTGDLLATIDELRGIDPRFLRATESPGRSALAAVLDHAYAGDVVRFALTPECTALRRRAGSTWA